jgi:hypothetical protein
MSFSPIQNFRLVARGKKGVACDGAGVALGAAELLRVELDSAGRRSCEIVPPEVLRPLLEAAYGSQELDRTLYIHRGLSRAARALEAGDLCLAGIETVLLRLTEVSDAAFKKIADMAALAKWGAGWQNQPRAPAGQPDGGQWTASDGEGEAPAGPSPFSVNDGVYRPATDDPHFQLTGGAEGDEASRRSNGAPEDFTRLEDVFPGLKDYPGLAAPLAPVDGFLGVSAVADAANLAATEAQYRQLLAEIKQIEPTFVDQELLPEGGIAGLTWQGRTNLINDLRMQRAVACYNILGDIGPFQVETLRFLQSTVDNAYEEAIGRYDAGILQPRLSRQEAIGNWVDFQVRNSLKVLFDSYGIQYGSMTGITINNRDYETTDSGQSYRIPDARLGDVAFDWTLSPKTIASAQIRGFFRADSKPRAAIIIRPSQLGPGNTYLIPRTSDIPL